MGGGGGGYINEKPSINLCGSLAAHSAWASGVAQHSPPWTPYLCLLQQTVGRKLINSPHFIQIGRQMFCCSDLSLIHYSCICFCSLLPLVCKMCPKKTETLIMWRPLHFFLIFPIILAWRHYNAERLIRCEARHISNSCGRLENVFGPPSLKDFFPPRSFFIYQCSFLQNDLVRHPSFKQQRWKRLALLCIIENAKNKKAHAVVWQAVFPPTLIYWVWIICEGYS